MPNSSSQYIKSPYFWDYKIKKSDLAKPEVKKFWLKRKINMCDWQGVKRKDLEKYLPELDIREDLKNLLKNFLEYEKK
ncbi:hypothetical protein A3B87_03220 [Candidatus Kuenenbacteria bacterium RIFCSPHIGHO2_02_FULL_39_13]|uniref:Uncharacterized protein n=1 Tax=Candidatus Kuenenbacteria bacterium RIFCSPHIGHO2_02_FULL_39_13 TaxID=1798561 RepID=A0A1F6FMW7_9BACT|nr:MAG: hypothetical protein A3B87_03220 [Candidatus Kuenenbacteria bacterium RIFCSPHIGHO2_02_FULL_39_13]